MNSSAYAVQIWQIPTHTRYVYDQFCRILNKLRNTVNLPPLYIPPHTQYEFDQFLCILSMYRTNSSAYSVYIGRFPRILSMQRNVVSSTLNVNWRIFLLRPHFLWKLSVLGQKNLNRRLWVSHVSVPLRARANTSREKLLFILIFYLKNACKVLRMAQKVIFFDWNFTSS